jgi:hypothetical protein
VTGRGVAAALLQRNAIAALVNVLVRVIARSYHFVIAVCKAKGENPARYQEKCNDSHYEINRA